MCCASIRNCIGSCCGSISECLTFAWEPPAQERVSDAWFSAPGVDKADWQIERFYGGRRREEMSPRECQVAERHLGEEISWARWKVAALVIAAIAATLLVLAVGVAFGVALNFLIISAAELLVDFVVGSIPLTIALCGGVFVAAMVADLATFFFLEIYLGIVWAKGFGPHITRGREYLDCCHAQLRNYENHEVRDRADAEVAAG